MQDCIEWTGCKDTFGYGLVRHAGKVSRVHRVTYEKAHGTIPSGLVVMHSCDNPACYNLQHLSLGTRADNNKDRDTKGRQRSVSGEESPQCKLTDDAVADIRSTNLVRGAKIALARKYDVDPAMITRVIKGVRK